MLALAVVLALLATLIGMVPDYHALAAGNVALPFPGGKAVKVIQGYNGGTHQGRSRFGLDLMLADEETSGADVLSPVDGTITFAQAPNAGNGCIAVAFKDGSHSVMLCHVILSHAFSRGESVTRGQLLGTVGAAGKVGNNGVPHIHMELHRGNGASDPVPFAGPDGLPLEGKVLAAKETAGVVSRREAIMSTNRPGSGSGASKPVVAAASVPSTVRSVPLSATASETADATLRMAVVQGTSSCLNVREKPAADAKIVGCLREGEEVALKPAGENGNSRWREVDRGWVASEYLARKGAVVFGTGGCLNVRESPSAEAAKVGCLADGTGVKIAEGPTTRDGSAWYRIEPAGSLKKGGWVAGKYLD